MGSSSVPSLALVLAADDQRVTVVKIHGENMNSYTLDRASANIAIRRGGQTMREQAERVAGLYAVHGRERAALHGSPSNPRDWDIYHVKVRPVSGEWDSNENWRAAEKYGNVGGSVTSKLLEIDRCRGASLAELVTDKRFMVVSVKLVEECARS
jgi:hypothetical protein